MGKGPWPGEYGARPTAREGPRAGREGATRGGCGGRGRAPGPGFPGESALAGASGGSRPCCLRPSASPGAERGWWGAGVLCGAASGAPAASRTPSPGTAKAGVRGFFPWASKDELFGFSPFAFIRASIVLCRPLYQQNISKPLIMMLP